MPALLDDPTSPAIYRTSGPKPYPVPHAPLPPNIVPRHVTLRDRLTAATLVPFSAPDQVPLSLVSYLCDQLNAEIEKGDTYPMISPMPLESFGPYWFSNFGAVMLLGDIAGAEDFLAMDKEGVEWDKRCLGTFYIKPNYPGRSSHVCNGGFIVTSAARNKGVGRQMGEAYLEWAPKLGYTYSVFNLVYETNVASCRIWDALGFKRIGRVKGCGALKSYPDQLVDAIIYGRDLGQEEDSVSEERFDKIRFYLKHGKYPNGADRAEKSRLRSAATHYKLIPAEGDEPEKLMLKGKEVIADPQRQYEIARMIHFDGHGGINKSTAAIAERYHWVRIKETVSAVIKNCPECNDGSKVVARPESYYRRQNGTQSAHGSPFAANNASQAPFMGTPQTAPARSNQVSVDTPLPPAPFSPAPFTPAPIQNCTQHIVDQAFPTDPQLTGLSAFNNGIAGNDLRGGEVPLDPQLVQTLQQRQQIPHQPDDASFQHQAQPIGFHQLAPASRTIRPEPEQVADGKSTDFDDAGSVGQTDSELGRLSGNQNLRQSYRMAVDDLPPQNDSRQNRDASPSEQLFRESLGGDERRPSTPPSVGQAGKKRKRGRRSLF